MNLEEILKAATRVYYAAESQSNAESLALEAMATVRLAQAVQRLADLYAPAQGRTGDAGVPAGHLLVGLTADEREVVINHPDIDPDENGVGHIVFSPAQARHLAALLLAKAEECKP